MLLNMLRIFVSRLSRTREDTNTPIMSGSCLSEPRLLGSGMLRKPQEFWEGNAAVICFMIEALQRQGILH
jgi:hypothetical protein